MENLGRGRRKDKTGNRRPPEPTLRSPADTMVMILGKLEAGVKIIEEKINGTWLARANNQNGGIRFCTNFVFLPSRTCHSLEAVRF